MTIFSNHALQSYLGFKYCLFVSTYTYCTIPIIPTFSLENMVKQHLLTCYILEYCFSKLMYLQIPQGTCENDADSDSRVWPEILNF